MELSCEECGAVPAAKININVGETPLTTCLCEKCREALLKTTQTFLETPVTPH